MNSGPNARRSFLLSAGGTVGALWLATHGRAIAQAAHHAAAAAGNGSGALSFLSAADAADVEAIASCIIPSGATAGAREARTVVFIDRALDTFFAARASEFRQGLAQFQQSFRSAHPNVTAFAAASADDQMPFLRTVETSPFFGTMIFMTVLGFLSSPQYGGNAESVGWKAIGFEDQHVFAPPFGYYDRDYPGFKPYAAREASK
jgi:hypothetical protein